jgi:hypothetical protein
MLISLAALEAAPAPQHGLAQANGIGIACNALARPAVRPSC